MRNFRIELRKPAHSAFLLSKLQALSCCENFSDTLLVCCDGVITKPKLAVGLLFPVLADEEVFNLPVSNCVILPDLTVAEVEELLLGVFCSFSRTSLEEDPLLPADCSPHVSPASLPHDEIHLKTHGISVLEDMWTAEEEEEEKVSEKKETYLLMESLDDAVGESAVVAVGHRKRKRSTVVQGRKERQPYSGPVYPGEHPYKCAYCDKRFKQVGHVHQHERTHTGTQKYECVQCSKKFSQLSHIREHERIHTGEKPFVCNDCGKRFTFSSGLKAHRKIHDPAERVYECRFCLKRFNQLANMKTHERLHTGDLKFMCSECGKCFNTKSNLARHQCRVLPPGVAASGSDHPLLPAQPGTPSDLVIPTSDISFIS